MPELKDPHIRFGSASKPVGNARPAGFRSGMPTNPKQESDPGSEKPKRRTLRDLFKRKKPRIKKETKKKMPKRRVKNRKKVRAKKRFGRAELILVLSVILIIGAAAAAGIILIGNRTVHQMPTITRTTEEPTESPDETLAPSDGSE